MRSNIVDLFRVSPTPNRQPNDDIGAILEQNLSTLKSIDVVGMPNDQIGKLVDTLVKTKVLICLNGGLLDELIGTKERFLGRPLTMGEMLNLANERVPYTCVVNVG